MREKEKEECFAETVAGLYYPVKLRADEDSRSETRHSSFYLGRVSSAKLKATKGKKTFPLLYRSYLKQQVIVR